METLIKYLKESLLDDLDTLMSSAEHDVNKSQTIGNDYKINGVYTNGQTRYFCNTFDKRRIKNICKNLYWSDQDIDVYKVTIFNPIENKAVIEMMSYICYIILNGDKTKLKDSGYIKSLFMSAVKDESWYKCLMVNVKEVDSKTIVIQIISTLAINSPGINVFLKMK